MSLNPPEEPQEGAIPTEEGPDTVASSLLEMKIQETQKAEATVLAGAELQEDTRLKVFEAMFATDKQRMNPRKILIFLKTLRAFLETNPDLASLATTRARITEYCASLMAPSITLSLMESMINDPLFQAFTQEPLVQQAARRRIIEDLQTNDLHERFKDVLGFQKGMGIPVNQELQGTLIASVKNRMESPNYNEDLRGFKEICDAFGVSVESDIHPLVIAKIHTYLKYGYIKDAIILQECFSLPEDAFFRSLPVSLSRLARVCGVTTVPLLAAFCERNDKFIYFLNIGLQRERGGGDPAKVPQLFRDFAAQEKLAEGSPAYVEVMMLLIERGIVSGDVRTIQQLQRAFALSTSVEGLSGLPEYVTNISTVWQLPTVEDVTRFCKTHTDFVLFVANSTEPKISITADDLPYIQAAHLTLKEAEELKRAKEDIRLLADRGTGAYGARLQALHRHCKDWQPITLFHLRRLSLEENHPKDLTFYVGLDIFPAQWHELGRSCGLQTLEEFMTLLSLSKEHIEKILSFAPGKRPAYVAVMTRMRHCPSQEMQRVRQELTEQLLETDDPIASYEKIETLFVENNLPLVAKIYRVFQILHPPEVLANKLGRSGLSPYLIHATPRRRYQMVFNDLLRVHIRSGNRSLRQFLEILRDTEQDLALLEGDMRANLDPGQSRRLGLGLAKFEAVLGQSRLGMTIDPGAPKSSLPSCEELLARYQKLRTAFGVEEGVPLHRRIIDMFCRPLGCERVEEVLDQMREAKEEANQRRARLLDTQADGVLTLEEGDLLKGVDARFIAKILQNGSVAKEYLGPSSQSDATPFDTDVSMVSADDASGGFKNAVENSIAKDYGDLLFVLKKQNHTFERTDANTTALKHTDALELFPTGVVGEKHYGIRTGFGSTEIDFIIVKGEYSTNTNLLRNLYTEIARNGWYIPVTDSDGTLLFTQEEYQRYRNAFAGLDRYDGGTLQLSEGKNELFQSEIDQQVHTMEEDQKKLESTESNIQTIIAGVLAEYGIPLKFPGDLSLGGARLQSTGSTSRRTNIESTFDGKSPFDFDFIVTLEDAGHDPPFNHAQEIGRKIAERLQPLSDDSHTSDRGYYQMRVKGAGAVEGADVDIGFAPYSELIEEGMHNIVAEQLQSISRQPDGARKLKEVRANIVLAKKILIKGHAYKKVEDGGFGGMGVEHWILQNGGNMLSAFHTFFNAASNGQRFVPLSDFKSRYMILSPGINVKFDTAGENFTENLTEEGYRHLCKTITDYLRSVNELPAVK